MVRAPLALVVLAFGVCVAAGGCVFDSGTDTGGGDGDGDGDGSGLMLEFDADPSLSDNSGVGEYDVVLTGARLSLRDMRVIGDATTLQQDSVFLQWGGDTPSVQFAPVPPGLFSRVRGDISGIDVRGRLSINSGRRNFQIKGSARVLASFSVDLQGVALGPGDEVAVTLTADLGRLINAIPWTRHCNADECELEENDAGFDLVTDELATVFSTRDPGDDE